MICGQTETHNGKRDTRTVLSKTFAITAVVPHPYARTEAKSSAAVTKYLL